MKQITLAIVIIMAVAIACERPAPPAPKYSIELDADRDRDTTKQARDYDDPDNFAELVDGNYLWSVGDKIGLFMMPTGTTATRILNNIPMTGSNVSPAKKAVFVGEITESQLQQIPETGKYDYYTYYPYNSAIGTSNFPTITFALPSTMTLQRNVIPTQYDIMWATPLTNYDPISYLDANGKQHVNHTIGFQYKHALSFLELSLEVNLMSQPIREIVITSNNGTILTGTLNVSLADGSYGWAGNTSTSMTINIAGNLDVNNGVLYIPMRPGSLAGQTLNFKLTSTSGNVVNMTINGGALVAGKTHALKLKVPLKVYFDQSPTFKDAGLSGKKSEFTYKGWQFGGNGNYTIDDTYITYPAGSIGSGSGMLATPVLNTATQSGRTSIPVYMRVDCQGGGAVLASNRTMYYRAVSASNYPGFLATSDSNLNWDYGLTGSTGRSWKQTGSFNISASNPRIAIEYVTSGAYKGWLYAIEIIPNY